MYLNGEWTGSPTALPVTNPFSGDLIDTVPAATPEQVEQALAAAEKAAAVMARVSAHERNQMVQRLADLVEANAQDLARTISLEEGKPLSEAAVEVARVPDLLRLSGFEGSQLRGETLPIDAQQGATGKMGLTVRVPCGVVVAITPFNFPLMLVAHKVGPALATGNAVILKPTTQTPLTALKFTRLVLEAGAPENALQCLTGSGETVGLSLCSDHRVRKISFTGSTDVGNRIAHAAGIKKLSLELGSNSPLIVLPDADLDQVASATAIGGYSNAGQVCISTQRILVQRSAYADFLDALKPRVEAIQVGDPLTPGTKLGAMISRMEAERVGTWVNEAVSGGARVVTGGHRDGAVYAPTILADVHPDMRVSRDELFGPAVAVTPVDSIEEAIALANDTRYGLGAGIFTRDITQAWRFAQEVQAGSIMINWTPQWRADLMPYGGLKGSGIGKEGPHYAVEEMTEIKTIVFHGLSG
jgi:acyl-CoA reductase-like NAD-dependent aldehyde dehydrogenase